MAGLGKRIANWFRAQDEAANALTGGGFRESISGTVGRAAAKDQWWAKHIAQPVINTINRNPQHCQQAYAQEEERRAKLGIKNA